MKAASKEISSVSTVFPDTTVTKNILPQQAVRSALLAVLIALSVAPVAAQEQWHPGLIDQQTRAVATDARSQFEHCLVDQLEKLDVDANTDPRKTTNNLINQCVEKLEPITEAHQQSNVPEQFTLQFITKIKNGFVRQLLPMMQQRAAAAG